MKASVSRIWDLSGVDLWQQIYIFPHRVSICVDCCIDSDTWSRSVTAVLQILTSGDDLCRLFYRFWHRESICDKRSTDSDNWSPLVATRFSIESFIPRVTTGLQIVTTGAHLGRFIHAPHWVNHAVPVTHSLTCFSMTSQADMNSQANISWQANTRTRRTRPVFFLLLHYFTGRHWFTS